MNLDAVTVNIRPRSPWEGMDMGFILARKWYWQLFLLWWLSALPFLVILTVFILLIPVASPQWAPLIFWLCKPLFETPILLWISKVLFGEQAAIRETLKESRRYFSIKRLFYVLLSRLSPYRSFLLPVIMLEGLEKKALKQRKALLSRGYESAFFLSIAGTCIEILLCYSFMSVIFWFIPEELRRINFGSFIFTPDQWLIFVCYCVSCSLFSPLYMCSGFMMYISRRVEFEAWDIEIGFKKIRRRVLDAKTNGAVLCLFFFWATLFPLNISKAESISPQIAKETITQVKSQKEFGQLVTEYRWKMIEKEKPEKENAWDEWLEELFEQLENLLKKLRPALANTGQFILFSAAGTMLAFLLFKYTRLNSWISGHFSSSKASYRPPKVMFGMDIRPETLPKDIRSSCLELLASDKKREAISLLYRSSLSTLVSIHELHIQGSFTEKECCHEVKHNRPGAEAVFFNTLTDSWISIAYGHRPPEKEQCLRLVHSWHELYGVKA